MKLCCVYTLNYHNCDSPFLFQLLVGSEDFDIRVFKEDEIVAEMTETEVGSAAVERWPETSMGSAEHPLRVWGAESLVTLEGVGQPCTQRHCKGNCWASPHSPGSSGGNLLRLFLFSLLLLYIGSDCAVLAGLEFICRLGWSQTHGYLCVAMLHLFCFCFSEIVSCRPDFSVS